MAGPGLCDCSLRGIHRLFAHPPSSSRAAFLLRSTVVRRGRQQQHVRTWARPVQSSHARQAGGARRGGGWGVEPNPSQQFHAPCGRLSVFAGTKNDGRGGPQNTHAHTSLQQQVPGRALPPGDPDRKPRGAPHTQGHRHCNKTLSLSGRGFQAGGLAAWAGAGSCGLPKCMPGVLQEGGGGGGKTRRLLPPPPPPLPRPRLPRRVAGRHGRVPCRTLTRSARRRR